MPQKKKRPSEKKKAQRISRRDFMKSVAGGVIAAGLVANIFVPKVRAASKQLKILQWSHFVPSFDVWLKDTYIKEWGQKNDTEVIVDHVSILELLERPAAEVAAQKGHDLVMFIRPPAAFEEHVVDLSEICLECKKSHGKLIPLAHRSTYNPKTGKYFGFTESYAPDPINYRKDLWDDVGVFPDTWEDIRIGGAKIKKKYNIHHLVYYELHDSMESAILREKQIKKWNRIWKIRLIEEFNPNWNDLYHDIIFKMDSRLRALASS